MTMTKATSEDIAMLIWNHGTPGAWKNIREIQVAEGLTAAEMKAGLLWWMENADGVRVEPNPFGWRVTPEERADPIVIGGEARHLIFFDQE
jgi:hypothetical protein